MAEPSAVVARGLVAGRVELLHPEAWPRLPGPMLLLRAVEAAQLVAAIAGLSFLGFGAQPPSPGMGRHAGGVPGVPER